MGTTMRAINKSRQFQLTFLAASLIASCVFSSFTVASDWDLGTSLSFEESYTSNIGLSATNEESTFITEITPTLSARRNAKRLQSNINYSLRILDYSSAENDDQVRHNLNASLKSELFEDHFFVDAKAGISQQFLNSSSSALNGANSLNADTTETYSFSISPYWQQKISDEASLLVRATYNNVSFDSSSTNDTSSLNFNVGFDFEPASSKIFWGIGLDQNQNNVNQENGSTSNSANAFIGYRHSAQFSTQFTYGYVNNDIQNATSSAAEDGDFWGVGFDWSPSTTTSMNASYNSKLQSGSDYGFNLTRQLKGGALTVSYTEGISDFQSQLLALNTPYIVQNTDTSAFKVINDPNYQLADNEILVISTGTTASIVDDQFISKSFSANLSISRSKSTYTLGAFQNNREYQSGTLGEESDTGIRLGWSNSLNRRMSTSVNYSRSSVKLNAESSDTLDNISFNLRRSLSRTSNASIHVNFQSRTSDVASREFDEYGLGLNFAHNF